MDMVRHTDRATDGQRMDRRQMDKVISIYPTLNMWVYSISPVNGCEEYGDVFTGMYQKCSKITINTTTQHGRMQKTFNPEIWILIPGLRQLTRVLTFNRGDWTAKPQTERSPGQPELIYRPRHTHRSMDFVYSICLIKLN